MTSRGSAAPSIRRSAIALAADVHGGAAIRVALDLPQNLARDRRGVALAEEDVFKDVGDGVALSPTQVGVRQLARRLADVEQEGGDGVRHGRAFGAEHVVAADFDALDLHHVWNLRGVAHLHLKEQDLLFFRDVVVLALLFLFQPVLPDIAAPRPDGDDVYLASASLANERLGGLVHLYPLDAQLGRAPHPRQERRDDDSPDEDGSDLDSVGALDDVDHRRVREDQRDEGEGKRPRAPTLSPQLRKSHGHRRRTHQDEHARRVSPALRVNVRLEDDRHREGHRREDQDERARRLRPVRGHPVARQVARHDVQQPGHRRRAREPEDQDCAHVVNGAETFAQEFVREVGERATVRRAGLLIFGRRPKCFGRNQGGRHETAGDQKDAHDERGTEKQFARVAHAARRILIRVRLVAFNQRHHGHAGLEPRKSEREFGKEQERDADHQQRVPVDSGRGEERVLPARHDLRVERYLIDAEAEHDEVEQEVRGDEDDGDADGLLKAFEEDSAEQRDQRERDDDFVFVTEKTAHERVLDDVRRRVRRRERDGDHEVGGDEPEQHQHEQLTLPPGQKVFEHRDRAFAVRAFGGDAVVDRERAEKCQQDEDQRGDGRERPGGQEGDARLVTERREIIYARQAHHLPPRVLLVMPLALVRPLYLLGLSLEQPAPELPYLSLLSSRDCRLGHLPLLPGGRERRPAHFTAPAVRERRARGV